MDENNKENLEIEEQEAAQPPETVEENTPEKAPVSTKPGSKGKKPSFFSGSKFKRGGMATALTVVFIAIVVVVNVLVSVLADRFPSMNVDLTAKKMNTLSEQALEVAGKVENKTEIFLIGEESAYRNDAIFSNYGIKYSQVANLAERLEEANGNIHTEFLDPDTNPTFANEYPNESLTSGKVLVRTEKRYKLLTLNDMFSRSQDQTTGETNMFSNADSALAAAIEVVNMDKVPVLTVATGHEEILTSSIMSYFLELMEKQNFEVREINILTEKIPEETQLLMIPTPKNDYTDAELDKLRAYLGNSERLEDLALIVTCFPGQGSLPKLEGFLEEWGVSANTDAVVAETDADRYFSSPINVRVNPSEEVLEGNYGWVVSPQSVPLEVLFSGNGEITAKALWTTADSAYTATADDTEDTDPDTSEQVVATMSNTFIQKDNKIYNRDVFVFGSSHVFADSFIAAPAFGNGNYVMDLMKQATGTDGSNVSVYTERVQTNVRDVTASQNTVVVLGLFVFTIALPVLILAAGLVIFLKRRHL